MENFNLWKVEVYAPWSSDRPPKSRPITELKP